MLEAVAYRFEIDLDKKWSKLSAKAQKIVMNGVDDNMMVKYRNRYGRTREYSTSYEGEFRGSSVGMKVPRAITLVNNSRVTCVKCLVHLAKVLD